MQVSFDVYGSVRSGFALTKTREVKIDSSLQREVSKLAPLPPILKSSDAVQTLTLTGYSADASIPATLSSKKFTPVYYRSVPAVDYLSAVVFGMRGAEYTLVCRQWELYPTPDGAQVTVRKYHKAQNSDSRRPRFDPVSTDPLTVRVSASLLAESSKGNVASSIHQSTTPSEQGYPEHVLLLRVNGRQQVSFFQPAEAKLGIELTRKFSI